VLCDGLRYFEGNDKVYLVVEEAAQSDLMQDSEEGEDDEYRDNAPAFHDERAKWNNIVLNYAADEASVRIKDDDMVKYCKLLFQAQFGKKGIAMQKGFNYNRVVNLVCAMKEEAKCRLVERVINYAVKDWSGLSKHVMKNSDFNFMERFCGAAMMNTGKRAVDRMRDELVGMDEVKKQVYNIVRMMQYNRIREEMNIKGGKFHNVHLMLGAPGTAKTTMAKFMGQIMVEAKLLPGNRFICVNGAELKGKYVGHSAPKTKELFQKHDIIVIDEAYSLVSSGGETDSFGREALAQLLIEIEEHSTDKLIIFAGYGGKKVTEQNNKMKDFLDANPGIRSRIASTIYFDSYSPSQMADIFMNIAKTRKYKVDGSARQVIMEHFEKRMLDENFGNGREARNLLEIAVVFAADRVMSQNKKQYTKAEMQTLTYEDIAAAIAQTDREQTNQYAENRKKYGF
jgi:SpoVK/Ycf46/Vps4 family AAA+-type ATPase